MDQAEQLRNIIKAGNVKRSRPLARVITVTSGKGGVGKSNTAINLAIQFRKMGKKVVILDAADCRSPHDSLPQTRSETDRINSAPLPNKSSHSAQADYGRYCRGIP